MFIDILVLESDGLAIQPLSVCLDITSIILRFLDITFLHYYFPWNRKTFERIEKLYIGKNFTFSSFSFSLLSLFSFSTFFLLDIYYTSKTSK